MQTLRKHVWCHSTWCFLGILWRKGRHWCRPCATGTPCFEPRLPKMSPEKKEENNEIINASVKCCCCFCSCPCSCSCSCSFCCCFCRVRGRKGTRNGRAGALSPCPAFVLRSHLRLQPPWLKRLRLCHCMHGYFAACCAVRLPLCLWVVELATHSSRTTRASQTGLSHCDSDDGVAGIRNCSHRRQERQTELPQTWWRTWG